MAILHRQDVAFSVAADGDLQPLVGGTVTVFDTGAVASGTSTDTTIPVYTGHGFATNDCLMLGLDETTFRLVTNTSATQITVNASLSVIDGDVLINLGTDTAGGSGTPNYDGSTVEIYDVPDDSSPLTDSEVSIDAQGNYEYFFNSDIASMEVIFDTDGVPLAHRLQDAAVLLSASGTDFGDNQIARFDGTTGLLIQAEYTSNDPTISDAGGITAAGSHTLGTVAVTNSVTVGTTLAVTGTTTLGGLTQPDADDANDLGVASTGRFRNLYLSGVASIGGALTALSTFTATGLTTLANLVCAHISASVGSAPSTVSNIGNNWGSTSAATFASNSTDTRFTVTVTTSGSTFGNPAVLTIPFVASYTTAPFAVVAMNSSGTGTTANISWTTTTSQIAITYKAVPVTGNTYIFSVIVIG